MSLANETSDGSDDPQESRFDVPGWRFVFARFTDDVFAADFRSGFAVLADALDLSLTGALFFVVPFFADAFLGGVFDGNLSLTFSVTA